MTNDNLHTLSSCDACGGTGTTGFRLMDMTAVKCKVCNGRGERR